MLRDFVRAVLFGLALFGGLAGNAWLQRSLDAADRREAKDAQEAQDAVGGVYLHDPKYDISKPENRAALDRIFRHLLD
jgi:hypothetical protein